jgi:prepilin-type N-terminal cleavage/methylation domain-containing protein
MSQLVSPPPSNGANGGNSIRPSHPRAFTLVELLVVIGIIAILIGLVVTVVPKIRRAAFAASTSAQLSAISGAIQQYYGDYKAYPGPLANNQLGSFYDPGTKIYANAQGFQLVAAPNTAGPVITLGATQLSHITGAQNLVLGLLGGLEYNPILYPSNPFFYNLLDIFPDGTHSGPVGAASLNPNNPRRQQSYLQVKDGEISVPSMMFNGGSGASFADQASRSPSDAPIPVFLDKYPDPLPILYVRTNAGGKAIVGVRNTDGSGNQLVDPQAAGYTIAETPQYDMCQVFDYTRPNSNNPTPTGSAFSGGFFGVNYSSTTRYHGLQNLGNQSLSPQNGTVDSIASGYANQGQNGVAYFRDPNFRADSSGSYDPLADNRHNGVAREKDGYLLISAGPDRAYGTTDDIIFPGTLLVSQ